MTLGIQLLKCKEEDNFPLIRNYIFCLILYCIVLTGKYDPSNENPKKWKANFRCALNSLPDVIIVPALCVRKGKDAYRVFKILPEKIPEKVRESKSTSTAYKSMSYKLYIIH